jgi:hypothetical protein
MMGGPWALAAITANVTLTNYAGFVTQNPGNNASGMLVIMRAPTNDINSRISVAFPTFTADQLTPLAVNAGSTGGYFWAGFNNSGAMEALGCSSTPINFNTPTGFIADGGSFNVDIVCSGPPAPPTGLSAATAGAGQLSISFTAGSANGSAITNYEYSLDGGAWTAIFPADVVSPVLIYGLTPGVSYSIRLRAVNLVGTSTASSAVVATPLGTPGKPTSVSATAGNTQATVTFTAPASNGGSAITGYKAVSDPDYLDASCSGAAACPITITGLTNGTPYTFQVTAINALGEGALSDVSNTVTPVIATQTITFAQPAAQSFGTTPTLTATASSNLTVTFTSSTTGVCTITSGGALTFLTTGSCTINADQAGDGTYQAAPQVSRTFNVNAVAPGAPTIGSATAGDTQATVTFTAPASNGGSAITTYTATANPGGATGNCAGPAACTITVTGLTNGVAYTFTVTATNAINTGSASAASNSVTPKAAQTITFAQPADQNFGTTPTLTATASSSLTVAFTSSTTGVCTITSGGALTFLTTGSCTINANQAGNGSYQAAPQVSRTFNVNAVAPGAPTIGSATAGDTQATVTFTAPASNGGAAITTYTATANPGGATGNCAGPAACTITVTGLTNGQAYTFTVTATNSAGPGSASAASNSVTPKSAQTITFAQPADQSFGTTPTLTATASSNLTVTFTSSTTGVCTITSGGALTFLTTGSCTINADQAGNGTYLAAPQASRTFNVNAVVPGAPTIGSASAGDAQATVTFTAPASNGGAAITTYTATANPGGATGNCAGPAACTITVTGLTNGQAYTFTVTATNSAGPGSASAASNSVTPKAAQTITFAQPAAQSFGTTPTLTATASSSLTVAFTSSTTGVCTITSGGALTFLTTGSCTINANQAGNGTYLAAPQVSRTFNVNAVVPGAPTIGSATAGDAQATVTFTAPASNGGAAIDVYTATASPGGASNTCAGPAACAITVTGLTNGQAYTFTVTAHNSAGTGPASGASNSVTPRAGPVVVSVGVPANGTYKAGSNLDFTVTWDSNVTVSGTPRIALVIGATAVQANYVSTPTATTTLFRYTVLSGQTDTDGIAVGALTLNGGTIQNAANSNATLTLNSVGSTAGVLVDTTGPTLAAANIVVNNQSDPHRVVLTFGEALDSTSLGSAGSWAITGNGGSPTYSVASVALSGGNSVTLTLSPVNMVSSATTITNAAAAAHLRITPPANLKDLVGNTYAAGQITEAGATHLLDTTAPLLSAVATSSPTSGGGTLAATASEKVLGYWVAVASGSGAPNVAQTKAGVSYAAVTVAAHGSGALPSTAAGTFSITGLAARTAYDIYLVTEDAAGNLSATVSVASLTTTAPRVIEDSFTMLPPPAPVPGFGNIPGVVNMSSGSGPALGNCASDMVRQALGGNVNYIGQTESGATQIQWNKQIISFYPLAATTSNGFMAGIFNQSINPLAVVTSCGTLTVAPAVYSLSELGTTLAGMGLNALINAEGVITVEDNGVVYVVRPDYIVTTGTPGVPRLFVDSDGKHRFTDSAGNTQIIYPAFLDPTALQTQVGLLGGSMNVQVDGTVFLALGGKTYTLTADLTLSGVPPEHAADYQWQNGTDRYAYRILTQRYGNLSQGMGAVIRP